MMIESTATVRDLRSLVQQRVSDYDGDKSVRLEAVIPGNSGALPPVDSEEENLLLVCNLGTRTFQLVSVGDLLNKAEDGFRSARKSHLVPSSSPEVKSHTSSGSGDSKQSGSHSIRPIVIGSRK